MTIAPIRPSDVAVTKARVLPDAVVKTWNRLIASACVDGVARITQETAVKALLTHVPAGVDSQLGRQYVFDSHWLDVEDMYRAHGWHVTYDRPGFNESYLATFEFRAVMKGPLCPTP